MPPAPLDPTLNALQQLLNGIFLGSVYALFAVGYTLVFGVLDVLNLAHSAVFTMAAVAAFGLVAYHDVSIWVAAPIAIVIAGLLGVVIELVTLRPLRRRNAPGIAPLISTIGLALALVALVEQARGHGLLRFFWREGANSTRFPPGTVPTATWHVGRLDLPENKVAILIVSLALTAVLAYVVQRTQAGRAMRAVAENPMAARLLGVDVDRVILLTVVASSALAGLAGVLYGVAIGDISPYIGRDQVELRGLAVIVLGGVGSIAGSILAGYLLGVIELLALLTLGTNVRAAVAFLALFLMLVVRPQGLLGRRVRDRV